MSKIQSDQAGIVTTNYHWDEHTQDFHVERVQDVEPLLERNKALQAAHWDGFNQSRDGQLLAEIPVAIAEQWLKEGVDIFNPDHEPEVRKRLNDPALRGFRMDTGAGPFDGIIIKGPR